MAQTNNQRVWAGIQLLAEGLRPFVERELRAKYGDDWLVRGLGAGRGARTGQDVNPDDPSLQVNLIFDNWHEVFKAKLSNSDRNYLAEARDIRNRWAHNRSFSTREAARALETIHLVLQAVSAGEQAVEVDRLRQALLRQQFEEQARSTRRQAATRPASAPGSAAPGLPPWRMVVEPQDDVTRGTYELAQFAADLHQVWRGDAAPEYGDPDEFFRRTFITEGLSQLLTTAVKRFDGKGGDPIVKLQTNFGGGKTHSLIALYHLASGVPASKLPGVEQMLVDSDLALPSEKVQRAVLVGHELEPAKVSRKPDGTEVHTLWGELAYQLGGVDGYELVAEADKAHTAPGAALIDLLEMFSPCLVLIDEWVAYARLLYGGRDLPAGSVDAQFTFAQTLTEAAKSVPKALVVLTIPVSDTEGGGEDGQKALARLENIVGRTEATWRPANTEESFEIVRRRLFKDLTPERARLRDAVVGGFMELYRDHPTEFPFACHEEDYKRRMTASYPIHPELFDRLFGDWSELERFQRTRGVLRLMAKVIHSLWMGDDSSLMILPGSIPIADRQVADELTRYLADGWKPVIETDVDGPNSLPYRLDRENGSTFGRLSAARRVAHTVYFGSAPSLEAANRGLDDQHIKLGCVQPGEKSPVFGDALRRLADNATYLYRDGVRYWYALKATVTRLAQDRAAHVSTDVVDEEIRRRLDRASKTPGYFARVHPVPNGPGDVPDDDSARLVIIGPDHPHDPKGTESRAVEFAQQVLNLRAGGSRRCRNMLVFLAADASALDDLRQGVRQWKAWSKISDDRHELGLDPFQLRQVASKVEETNRTLDLRIEGTFHWILNPTQLSDPTGPIRWETAKLTGSGPLAERVADKMRHDETLVPAYGGSRMRNDLDKIPLWPDGHIELNQLWDYYCQYLYLSRLVSRPVFDAAVEGGVMSLSWITDGFAYADGFDGTRYEGLVAAQKPTALAPSGLVVRPDVAEPQIIAEREEAVTTGDTEATTEGGVVTGGFGLGAISPSSAGPGLPTHYYGRVTIDAERWARTVADIAEAVVAQLQKQSDAKVEITIEIEADADGGFDEKLQSVVAENTNTLKFNTSSFEEG